jgi:hypothetical protein
VTEADLVLHWGRAFVVTAAVELGVLVPGLRAAEPRLLRRGAIVLLGQMATHPWVWFVLPALPFAHAVYWAIAETFAVLVEALLYRLTLPLAWRRALLMSLLANAASVAVGFVLRMARWL